MCQIKIFHIYLNKLGKYKPAVDAVGVDAVASVGIDVGADEVIAALEDSTFVETFDFEGFEEFAIAAGSGKKVAESFVVVGF